MAPEFHSRARAGRVVFVSASRTHGGAAVAARRLGEGLERKGWDVRWLVKEPARPGDNGVQQLKRAWYDRLPAALMSRLGLFGFGIISSFRLVEHPWVKQADVVHLHNLHPDYFNILALPRLAGQKRVVWTLHDMWAFTGHCSYSYDCTRWMSGCGRCPYLDTYPAVPRDVTGLEWRLKQEAYNRSHLRIVTPSKWLGGFVQRSVLKAHFWGVVPYGIDTEFYRPASDKRALRELLQLDVDRLTLLMTAVDFHDRRKGADLVKKALASIPERQLAQCQVVLMGPETGECLLPPGVTVHRMGYVQDDTVKQRIFAASDVLLLPSRADNLPVTLIEAMACGTPAVALDSGGVGELVRHQESGYLAREEEFSSALCHAIRSRHELSSMGMVARTLIECRFKLEMQARAYATGPYC